MKPKRTGSNGSWRGSRTILNEGILLEALERVAAHLQGKATHQIGHSREGGEEGCESRLTALDRQREPKAIVT